MNQKFMGIFVYRRKTKTRIGSGLPCGNLESKSAMSSWINSPARILSAQRGSQIYVMPGKMGKFQHVKLRYSLVLHTGPSSNGQQRIPLSDEKSTGLMVLYLEPTFSLQNRFMCLPESGFHNTKRRGGKQNETQIPANLIRQTQVK